MGGKLFENNWVTDSKPKDPPKACLLWFILCQWIFKAFIMILALTNIGILMARGFFYIDANNQISYGGCFSRGDLFSLCINGMAASVVSVVVPSIFILKDFIMWAVNSCSWTRWLQVVEAVSFLLLALWWAVSASVYSVTVNSARSVGTPIVSGNSTVSAPDLSQDTLAAAGMNTANGLQFALLGMSLGAVLHFGIQGACSYWHACRPSQGSVHEDKMEL